MILLFGKVSTGVKRGRVGKTKERGQNSYSIGENSRGTVMWWSRRLRGIAEDERMMGEVSNAKAEGHIY